MRRIMFETARTSDSRFVQVKAHCEGLELVYRIDMETDVIDEITFSNDQGVAGNLKFNYLQSIEQTEGQFESPTKPAGRIASRAEPGLLWLAQLVDGSF
jgi:hypothetical protein